MCARNILSCADTMVHYEHPINPLPFVVAIWAHKSRWLLVEKGLTGLVRFVYGVGGGEIEATCSYIIKQGNEEEIKAIC